MAAEQRLVLEQLFGRENLVSSASSYTPSSSSYEGSHYRGSSRNQLNSLYDPRICRSFVVGTCPHDLFIGTKEDMGRCKRLHLEKYKILYESQKRAYDKHVREVTEKLIKEGGGGHVSRDKVEALLSEEDKRVQKMVAEFEYDYMKDLQYHTSEVSHKISIAEENLKHTPEEQAKIDKITKDLDNMDVRIGLLTQEIELLLKQQHLTKALVESNKLNDLLAQRAKFAKAVRELSDNIGQAGQQKLEVCNVCGAYLSRLDSDRRLADHFTGKIHLSYVQMRSALKELQRKLGVPKR